MILGIYGAGGLGREVLDLARIINNNTHRWNEILFIDDVCFEKKVLLDARILSFDEIASSYTPKELEISIAIGEPAVREILMSKVEANGYSLTTLVHPGSQVSPYAKLAPGVIIQYGAFVSCNTEIGKNVLFQPFCCVGHDSTIADNSVISSYVVIAGNCHIGEKCYIGLSVPIREGITIGSNSIVGMASAVLRDIPESVVAMGNPARAMKMNDSGRVFGKK